MCVCVFLMHGGPPGVKRTDKLCPYSPLVRSEVRLEREADLVAGQRVERHAALEAVEAIVQATLSFAEEVDGRQHGLAVGPIGLDLADCPHQPDRKSTRMNSSH